MARDGSALVKGAALASRSHRGSQPSVDPAPVRLVGRESELATLRWAWRRAVAGEGRMITLAGEPGIGKTRLAHEVARQVGTGRAWVLSAECDAGAPAPYGALVEALRHCRPALPTDLVGANRAGAGSRLIHLLDATPLTASGHRSGATGRAGLASVDDYVDGSVDPLATRRQMLEDATDVFCGMARSAPVLLLVDDLEMSDRSTLVLVRHLASLAPSIGMLVVGTYCDASIDRADPLFEALQEIATGPGYEGLVLAGLERRSVRSIVGDPSRGDELWAASEGNPLALHCLMAIAAIDGDDKGGHDPRGPHPWPAGVEDTVDHWLARLTEGTRHVLVAAAAIGRQFDMEVLTRATHLRRDRVEAGIVDGRRAGVIEPFRSPGGDGVHQYRFTHSLFQRALYRNLTPNQLVHLHGQVADALEHHPSPGWGHQARLTFHLGQASPVGRSVEVLGHCAAMGDHAMSVGGYEDAAGLFGRALAAAGAGAAPAERADLLVALADAHWRSGDHLRARTALLEAATAARSIHDGERLAVAALGLARLAPVWGGDSVLGRLLEEALAQMESGPPTRSTHGRSGHGGSGEVRMAAVRSCLAEVRQRRPEAGPE